MKPQKENTKSYRIRDGVRLGFTLIELLVVIAVIAVLAGILLPALSKTKDTSRTVSCSSQLKQIGVYWNAYASGSGDMLPPGHQGTMKTVRETWMGRILVNLFTEAELNAPSNNVKIKDNPYAAVPTRANRKFAPLVCPDHPTISPAQATAKGHSGWWASGDGASLMNTGLAHGISYGINTYGIGGEVYIVSASWSPSATPYTRYTQIKKPSRQLAFTENAASDVNVDIYRIGPDPLYHGFNRLRQSSIPGFSPFRHDRQTALNVVWCDGHTEKIVYGKRPMSVKETKLAFGNP